MSPEHSQRRTGGISGVDADCRTRALLLWPKLDRAKLRRTNGDPARVARLVEQRTRLPYDDILSLLTRADRAERAR